jgi:hypothetical protein
MTNAAGQFRQAGNVTMPGIAFGGDTGVKSVEISPDGGSSWRQTELGKDEGKYSFRRWQASITPERGEQMLMVRCTNSNRETQPLEPNWNPPTAARDRTHAICHQRACGPVTSIFPTSTSTGSG